MDDATELAVLEAAFRECQCDACNTYRGPCDAYRALRKAERKIAKRLQRKGGE